MKITEAKLKQIIKEETEAIEMVDYHLENKIPFSRNIYRIGSDNYFRVIHEARKIQYFVEGFHPDLPQSKREQFYKHLLAF